MKRNNATWACLIGYGGYTGVFGYFMWEDMIHPTQWKFAIGVTIFCALVALFSVQELWKEKYGRLERTKQKDEH